MSRALRVMLADSAATTRRRAVRLLMQQSRLEIADVCASGREALAAIEVRVPDLALIELELAEMDALALARAVGPQRMPLAVFVSADEAALKVFHAYGIQALHKPYDRTALAGIIESARESGEARLAAYREQLARLLVDLESKSVNGEPALQAHRKYLERILVRQSGQIIFLKVADIDWMESAANYIRLHCGANVYVIRDTMNAMEQKLPPDRFVRVHRSTIVNVDRIARMYPWFSGDYMVVLKDGTELRLSRYYRASVEERIINSI